MNPYHMSVLIYVLLVALVSLTGISVVAAMIVVYTAMVACMVTMQKRARQAYIPQPERRRQLMTGLVEDVQPQARAEHSARSAQSSLKQATASGMAFYDSRLESNGEFSWKA